MSLLTYLLIALIFANIFYIAVSYLVAARRKEDIALCKRETWRTEKSYHELYCAAMLLALFWIIGVPLLMLFGFGYMNYYILDKKIVPFVLKKLGDE